MSLSREEEVGERCRSEAACEITGWEESGSTQ